MPSRFLLLLLAVVVALVPSLHATTVPLIADASVTTSSAVNMGLLANLPVSSGTNSLLKFDLTTLPTGTTSAQVSKALLTVFVNRVNTSGSVSLLTVTGTWTETGLIGSNAPATGASLGSVTVGTSGTYVTFDVTTQVQAWLTSTANNGVELNTTAANVQFDSKENDQTAHPAQLDITLVNQGPQGVQGNPGTTGTQGMQGNTGPQGNPGLQGNVGPAGLTYNGTWAATTSYTPTQSVYYSGSTYINITAIAGNASNPNPASDTTHWSVLAAQGAQGNPVTISGGAVTYGTGSSGTVGVTSSSSNPTISVTLPQVVQSVTAGTITNTGSTGTLTIGGTAAAPTINANFPAASSGASGFTWVAVTGNALDTATPYYAPPSGGTPNGLGPSLDAALGTGDVYAPSACTVSALYVRSIEVNASYLGNDTSTFVVQKNDVNTSMTCSVTNAAVYRNVATCSDTTHTFTIAARDLIELQITQTSGTPYLHYSTQLVCQ